MDAQQHLAGQIADAGLGTPVDSAAGEREIDVAVRCQQDADIQIGGDDFKRHFADPAGDLNGGGAGEGSIHGKVDSGYRLL